MKASTVIDFFSMGFKMISDKMFKSAISKATTGKSVNLGKELQQSMKQKPKTIPK